MRGRWAGAVVVAGLLQGVCGCAVTKLATKQKSWPVHEGALEVQGVAGEVRIVRDTWGVPHIQAGNEHDATFGLGFVHASDRLFQADLQRTLVFGRLGPWFGSRVADLDQFMDGLDLEGVSKAAYERSAPKEKAILDAYSAGFNAGIAALPALPIEYRLLGVEPARWEPHHSAAIAFLQSWNLSENPASEVAAVLLADLEPGLLDALYRHDDRVPEIDAYWDELRRIDFGELTPGFLAFTQALGGAPDSSQASNNWIVGPERTESGSPLLANDPHLTQGVPSLWYVAHARGGELDVAGATLPGTPAVVIGHNQQIAWGLTNVMADGVDLAVLEREGSDGYRLAGASKQIETRQVASPQAKGEPISGELWFSEVGPVVAVSESHLVALRWHALEVEDESTRFFAALNRAGSVEEVLGLAATPLIVSQNLVVADREGDWAWQTVGSMVRRRSHTGRVPYPASDPAHGWDGWLEGTPGEHRPDRGFVVTANSRPEHALADAISTSYVPPHRFDRITEVLEHSASATPEEMRRLQRDVREMTAASWLPGLVQGAEPRTPLGREVLEQLLAWDLEASVDSVGATAWAVFSEELVRIALADELDPFELQVYLSSSSPGRGLLHGDLERFLAAGDVVAALDSAGLVLGRDLGSKVTGWTWGRRHPLKLAHPFGDSPLLRRWNMEPVPFAGSNSTVSAASWSWRRQTPERPVGGMPSLRIVMPLDDLSASTLGHPGGQSGHPGHPDYASHYRNFVDGTPTPLVYSEADVAAHSTRVLLLKPAP